MKAFEIVGWVVESEFWCAEHAQIDDGDEETGHATPVFAGDEGADEHACRACLDDEIEARRCVYLDETRITAVRATAIPRHRTRKDGYGTLVPGAYMLQLDGKRWHRVRTTCWSNAGTDFVRVGGRDVALVGGWFIRWGLRSQARIAAYHGLA